jgi:lipopolysaccharide/colanic/teichoic acid biosynthesis glycosyltransferase
MKLAAQYGEGRRWMQPSQATMGLKRAMDIFGALIGLTVLSPVLAVIALGIKLDSRGPVFFRQTRMGQGGSTFRIFKFRSMRVEPARPGIALTVREDKRVTQLGGFLRKAKLDELPQLINVLAGDMSLVGPRPEVPEFIKYYTPGQRAIILSVKPGMTDYAAIRFRHESELLDSAHDPVDVYRHEIMPIKFVYYERYVSDIGILNDLRIILATIVLLVGGYLPHWLAMERGFETVRLLRRSDAKAGHH